MILLADPFVPMIVILPLVSLLAVLFTTISLAETETPSADTVTWTDTEPAHPPGDPSASQESAVCFDLIAKL